MRLSLLFASITLLGTAATVQAATLTWDCTRVPNICSNDCYAINCASKPTTLHRDSANASINRAATACRSPNRCANGPADANSCGESCPFPLYLCCLVDRDSNTD